MNGGGGLGMVFDDKPVLKFGLLALFLGLSIAGIFLLGGLISCGGGGGVLSLSSLTVN